MPTLKVWDGSQFHEIKGDKGDPGEVTNAALESRVAPIEGDVSAIDTRVTTVETETADAVAAVQRVDPGVTAPAIGASLREGPDGPAWAKDAVSADWYSNPNDALTAAGDGGVVRFSADTIYDLTEPLLYLPNQQIIGDNPNTTTLRYGGEAIMQPRSSTTGTLYPIIRNLRLLGDHTAGIGLDARLVGRGYFENIRITQLGSGGVGVSWGGDQDGDLGGWTNTFIKGDIVVPEIGTGMKFDGATGGGTGARTANNIRVGETVINIGAAATSIGIEIVKGDSILIDHCDIGYSLAGGVKEGIPFLLRSGARGNLIALNRTELVGRDVVIEGGMENEFLGNWFTSYHATHYPVMIHAGSVGSMRQVPNQFLGNRYNWQARQPYVWESDDLRTFVAEMGTVRAASINGQVPLTVTGSSGSWFVTGNGSITWPAPSNASFSQARLLMESSTTGALRWDDGTLVKIPRFASLPNAVASRRGAVVRVEGGTGVADKTYECRKQADDTYAWVEL